MFPRTPPSNRSSSTSPKSSSCKYVYDLPYNVRKSLCDLLDADGSWRQLGGEYFGLDEIRLTLVSHAFLRGGSPTNDLLLKWEQTNPKILQLFKYFASMKHLRAMNILKPFVDPVTFDQLFTESQMNSRPLFVNLKSSTNDNYDATFPDKQENNGDDSYNSQTSQQGAVGGCNTSLPPYNSGFYCHNYVNLNNQNDEFKVSNNDLGKGMNDKSKDGSQSWNNFSENEAKFSNIEPAAAQGQEQSLSQQVQQMGNNKQSIISSMASSTKTSVLSQVEEDLEIMYKELMIATRRLL